MKSYFVKNIEYTGFTKFMTYRPQKSQGPGLAFFDHVPTLVRENKDFA